MPYIPENRRRSVKELDIQEPGELTYYMFELMKNASTLDSKHLRLAEFRENVFIAIKVLWSNYYRTDSVGSYLQLATTVGALMCSAYEWERRKGRKDISQMVIKFSDLLYEHYGISYENKKLDENGDVF